MNIRKKNPQPLLNKVKYLLIPLSLIILLNLLNLKTTFPPSVCLGCDQQAYESNFGWPTTFLVSNFECKGGDPNNGGLTKIGCVQELASSYRYDGLAADGLVVLLVMIGSSMVLRRRPL